MTLTPGDGAVGEDRLRTLAGLRELIPPAEASLDTLKLSAATSDLLGDAASQYLPRLLPK